MNSKLMVSVTDSIQRMSIP